MQLAQKFGHIDNGSSPTSHLKQAAKTPTPAAQSPTPYCRPGWGFPLLSDMKSESAAGARAMLDGVPSVIGMTLEEAMAYVGPRIDDECRAQGITVAITDPALLALNVSILRTGKRNLDALRIEVPAAASRR